jgi:RNA polymerase sigma factor (sigma-70 family)
MPQEPPRELSVLLDASDRASRAAAWERFLAQHSQTILRTTRFLSRDYDGSMDRYRFALEGLRANDFRRLRAYEADPKSKFSTWLVVVVRRLCRDFERQKYGRLRSDSGPRAREDLATRRRLVDLLAERLDHHQPRVHSEKHVIRKLELDELRLELRAALEKLSAQDRLLLRLRFEDEVPVRQIADIARLPSVFHVYRRLKKALGTLREALAERGFDA